MSGLLIDFEATGIDVLEDRIIEVGALLVTDEWDTIGSLSTLVSGNVVTSEITALTGITQTEANNGVTLTESFELLIDVIGSTKVDWVVAYNKEYDENLCKAELARTELVTHPTLRTLFSNPWMCAMTDIESNYQKKCWKMSHLALDYGIAVDPSKLHRAINDVELMREILRTTGQTPKTMRAYQQVPWIFVQAIIPAPWTDGGKGRDEAKKLGFSWEKAKGSDRVHEKLWVKRVKATSLDRILKESTIKVREIK